MSENVAITGDEMNLPEGSKAIKATQFSLLPGDVTLKNKWT